MNPDARGHDRPCRRAAAPLRASATPAVSGRLARPVVAPTRRQFLGWLAMAPFAVAASAMLQRLGLRHQPAPVVLSADTPVGVTFVGEVVVNRSPDGRIRAFSAKCTHLGCRLQQVVDGLIVCSCHGSRFHADGRVATGPANRPLDELPVTRDADSGGWRINAG